MVYSETRARLLPVAYQPRSSVPTGSTQVPLLKEYVAEQVAATAALKKTSLPAPQQSVKIWDVTHSTPPDSMAYKIPYRNHSGLVEVTPLEIPTMNWRPGISAGRSARSSSSYPRCPCSCRRKWRLCRLPHLPRPPRLPRPQLQLREGRGEGARLPPRRPPHRLPRRPQPPHAKSG